MLKKIILIFAIFVLFFSYHLAFADLAINEIKYSPTTKQWVEIYNNSDNTIDLTQYKILDAGAEINGHSISLCSGMLSSNSYAIIAKVPEDFSNPDFILCKSSLGIKSTANDTIILKIGSDAIDTVLVAEGSAIDGNSLQKISGSWVSATPTPGEANENTTLPPPDSNLSSGGSSTSVVTNTKVIETPKIKTEIISKTFGFVGIPIDFQGNALGYSGEKLQYGRYFWNFGDGDSKEVKANDVNMQKFTHAYFYPGEYVVSSEYYSNYYGNIPDASSKITIKVALTDLLISAVGNERDFFVEILNNTSYEADISNWILSGVDKNFIFPRNTIIGSKKKIIISSKVTGFSINDKNNLRLLNSQWEIVFIYGTSNTPNKTVIPKKQLGEFIPEEKTSVSENSNSDIYTENLSASVVSGDIGEGNPIRVYILTLVLTVFVGGSAGMVYFIRRKKVVDVVGGDFKILDE